MKDRKKRMKSGKKFLSFVMAVILIFGAAASLPVTAQADTGLLVTASGADANENEAVFLYVALNGSDDNDGSKAKPFATLQAAINDSRRYLGTVVINVREGYYKMGNTIKLTEEDDNLVIRAYPGEEVIFSGGFQLPYADFKAVTDKAVLERILDEDAKKGIKTVNLLQTYGLTTADLGQLKVSNLAQSPALSYNGVNLTLAEYPNGDDKYLYTERILVKGDQEGATKQYGLTEVKYTVKDFDRYKQWKDTSTLWVETSIGAEWRAEFTPAILDENGAVTSYSYYVPARVNAPVKFINLLEELDAPGEWYLDYETGDLYVYPPENMKEDESFVYGIYSKVFFQITDADQVTIENMSFTGTTNTMFSIKNSDGVVINNCDISNTGSRAISFDYCYNSGVQNCNMHDLGNQAIYFNQCGDRATLTPGNCFIVNNRIERYSQLTANGSAIQLFEDMTSYVAYNVISDGPYQAIMFASNDTIFEYNEIYDVCKQLSDGGAIYTGRYFNTWGNEIRNNYIHDLRAGNVYAVYLDDESSQTDVHNNVIYNCGSAGLIGGGHNNVFSRNLIIETGTLTLDHRGLTWGWVQGVINNSNRIDWHTDAWAAKYPELMNILEDDMRAPKYNVFEDNFLYNSTRFNLTPEALETTYGGTISIDMANVSFNQFFENDYTRVEDWVDAIDTSQWEKIGNYEYVYEDKWVEGEASFKELAYVDPYMPVLFFGAENIATWRFGWDIESAELIDNYVHLIPSGGDPVYGGHHNLVGARYVAVKYRTVTPGLLTQVYVGSPGADVAQGEGYVYQEMIADGEWHIAVMDTQKWIDAGLYDGVNLSYFCVDPLDTWFPCDEDGNRIMTDGQYVRNPLPEGTYMDIQYYAFFDSEEAANNYDPEITPTSLFLPGHLVDRNHELSAQSLTQEEGYIHIVPESENPFYHPIEDVDGARYVAVKYRTATAEGLDLQLYIRSYGKELFEKEENPQDLKVELITDGEWHIAVLDTQPLIDAGLYDGSSVTFLRLDPLESDPCLDEDGNPIKDSNGEYVWEAFPEGADIDIAYIGFFHTEKGAQEYVPYTE